MTVHERAEFAAIIPARYESSRLPGKVLADIAGKAMIHHVVDRVEAAQLFDIVLVATDDQRVIDYCADHGIKCTMTSSSHHSGTDRIAEAAQSLPHKYIVNVQGDEPFISVVALKAICDQLSHPTVHICTLSTEITETEYLLDYNVVKLIYAADGRVLYFSRQAIPAQRDVKYSDWLSHAKYYRHLGIYGFEKQTLLEVVRLPQSTLEKTESLEQLRWLENGYQLYATNVADNGLAVDTEADLALARSIMKNL